MPSSPRLKPIARGTRASIRDRDAYPPAGMPGKNALEESFEKLTERLEELQRVFAADRRFALLIVLQGRDASGKDGTIRHVGGAFNPQGCRVTSFKAPTEKDLSHDFLWRIHAEVPERGMIGIFNRSHYEDVLAVRVHRIAPKKVWQPRMAVINEFERGLSESNVIIRKFFLHISRDEQRERLLKRIDNPDKNWKFRAGDLEDRERWNEYTAAYHDVLTECSTPWAPWFVVPADDKKVRDYLIARELVSTLEGLKLRFPPADETLERYRKVLEA